MIGQDKLLNRLKSYSLFEFPHSILLIGEEGCGKHTVVDEISKYFDFELMDITDMISLDTIIEINQRLVPTVYLINMNSLTDREQNIILKFLEEPSPYAYIMLISEGTHNLLGTIVNRCILFEFEPYTKEQLSTFYKGEHLDSVLKICSTPGQVLSINGNKLEDMLKGCNDIKNILKVSYYESRLITNSINLNNEYDKYDLKVFLRALLNSLYSSYLETRDDTDYKLYLLVDSEVRKLRDSRLNREKFLLSLITKMWRIVNGQET